MKKLNLKVPNPFKKEKINEFKNLKVVTADGKFVEMSTGLKAYAVVAVDREKRETLLIVGQKFHTLRKTVQYAILAREFYKEDLATYPIETILERFEKESAKGAIDDSNSRSRLSRDLAADLSVLNDYPNKRALRVAKKRTTNLYEKTAAPMYNTIVKEAKNRIKSDKKAEKTAAETADDIAKDESLTINGAANMEAATA